MTASHESHPSHRRKPLMERFDGINPWNASMEVVHLLEAVLL
jgi:hypothetical protein